MKQETNAITLPANCRLLTDDELQRVEGAGWLAPAIVASIIISAINNFQDIREGLVDGFNLSPRYPEEECCQ